MTHNMNLKEKPFKKIKNGEKTIELRLNDPKRQKISVGDTITFTLTENYEKIFCKVLNFYRYKNFAELYKNLDLKKCGYGENEISNATYKDMEQYYSKTDENKFGVLGIEIELITDID